MSLGRLLSYPENHQPVKARGLSSDSSGQRIPTRGIYRNLDPFRSWVIVGSGGAGKRDLDPLLLFERDSGWEFHYVKVWLFWVTF